jgi:hydroxyethylthiazole kinase-like uncharacterized protein yjeF
MQLEQIVYTCCSMQNTPTLSDIRELLPPRHPATSKFDYGRVAVIGGTKSMRGAPSLTSNAAIALGAGIVDLITPSTHPLTPREVIAHEMAAHDDGTIHEGAASHIEKLLSRATVVAIGPGLGDNSETIEMLSMCIDNLRPEVPVVIDADGLRCLPLSKARQGLIITPHMGEFARLLARDRTELELSYVERAKEYAQQHGMIVHVKHVPSVTTDGNNTAYLLAGTPAMATAGAGDVLTGIIAALLAQHVSPFHAARVGAWLHAKAGENIVQATGRRSLMAHELISSARHILSEINSRAQTQQTS